MGPEGLLRQYLTTKALSRTQVTRAIGPQAATVRMVDRRGGAPAKALRGSTLATDANGPRGSGSLAVGGRPRTWHGSGSLANGSDSTSASRLNPVHGEHSRMATHRHTERVVTSSPCDSHRESAWSKRSHRRGATMATA